MPLSLIILAAGMGTRYGGNKPLAAVGPGGQSLFEYSVYDAFRAGFRHVVFVVNEKQDIAEITGRLAHCGSDVTIEFVVQTVVAGLKDQRSLLDCVSRTKPWGTAHAVLVCHAHIKNPFVVINADDYYGRSSFETIGRYLLDADPGLPRCALPGYQLNNTLSQSGGVNRGICVVGPDGYLQSIDETRNIYIDEQANVRADQTRNPVIVRLDSIVSMTFWGFSPVIFSVLDKAFQRFLDEATDLVHDEFYIPDVVDFAIKSGMVRVKVFATSEKWKGLTYANDLAEVRRYMAAQTDAGLYPRVRPS